ncbi:MAG: DNA-directed RNA polymerase subunit omega [Miltoncostaeaceae bacterium]
MDQSLEHVDGSRYALVHAVAKRARQITLWLTADPTELRAESAPPPAPGELTSRDPVALAEAEILNGEVHVRWDPEGRADDVGPAEVDAFDDELLVESLDDEDLADDDLDGAMTPALAQVLEGALDEEKAAEGDDTPDEAESADEPAAEAEPVVPSPAVVADGEIEEISLEEVDEPEDDDEDESLD